MARQKRKEWTVNSLAVEFKRDSRTVAEMLDGLEPHRKDGKSGFYWMRDVFDHLVSQGEALDPTQESAKLNQARRLKVEIETQVLNGTLCDTDAVVKLWSNVVTNARAKLLTLPHKLSHQMVGMEFQEISDLLTEEIHEVLNELSSTEGAPEHEFVSSDSDSSE